MMVSAQRTVEPINIMVERYRDSLPARQAELDNCLLNNLACPAVTRIWLFGSMEDLDQVEKIPGVTGEHRHKINLVRSSERMTFAKFFEFASGTLAGQICGIVNSDIYFDDTLDLLSTIDFERYAVWLTRWDVRQDGTTKLLENMDSADSWFFRAPFQPAGCDFSLGRPGCDNRMAYVLRQAGREPVNPSRTIKSYHLHLTGKRNYSANDVVPPPYLRVRPIALGEIGHPGLVVPIMAGPPEEARRHRGFIRASHGRRNQAVTVKLR